MSLRSTSTCVAGAVVALALGRAVASSAGDDPAPPAVPPTAHAAARATPGDVAKYIAGWAQPEAKDIDATTGYPKKIRRVKDAMVMVLIPSGTFQMGVVPGDAEVQEEEKPRHAVMLSKAYYMDESEVTNQQFEEFVAATAHKTAAEVDGKGWTVDEAGKPINVAGASWRAPLLGGKRPSNWERHPVVQVSWGDAKAFSDWAGVGLPTEAQFERALRGGTDGQKYPWGDTLPPPARAGNVADETVKKKFTDWSVIKGYDDGYELTAPVKSYAANAYGLFDLSGNVWEWCSDWYDAKYYASSPPRDPAGAKTGSSHVARGGSWDFGAIAVRSSCRGDNVPTYRSAGLGFRCARSLP